MSQSQHERTSRNRPFAKSGHKVQNHMLGLKLSSGTSKTKQLLESTLTCLGFESPTGQLAWQRWASKGKERE